MFKAEPDRREKVIHRWALFKMAVPSISAAPSPTTATGLEAQPPAAKLLVDLPSLKASHEA